MENIVEQVAIEPLEPKKKQFGILWSSSVRFLVICQRKAHIIQMVIFHSVLELLK